MKPIKELLILLKENLITYKPGLYYKYGLCRIIIIMIDNNIVNDDEYVLLYKYIRKYAPKSYYKKSSLAFFWEPLSIDNPDKEPRIKWLEKRIKIES